MANTIQESFTLPSHLKCYGLDKECDGRITLRSMTVAEEMKRLSNTKTPYKVMCDIIEDCIVGEKLPISVYDLCLGDYQFLLHKLRIVTYGTDYKMTTQCPICKEITEVEVDLEGIDVKDCDTDFTSDAFLTLSTSNYRVELNLQTPRMLDEVSLKIDERKKKVKDYDSNFGIVFTLMNMIKKVDGKDFVTPIEKEEFVKKLPMKDVNQILAKSEELNKKVGLDTNVLAKCTVCGCDIVTPFRLQSEFFGPSTN